MQHGISILRALGALLTAIGLLLTSSHGHAQGKIKGTAGVSSIQGSGGGGLIPWATLGSYAARGQTGATVFASRADVDDFQLDVAGAAINFHDRIELSVARQSFTIKASDSTIHQDRFNARYRVAGDILYEQLPQITVGVEHGSLKDPATARAVGAHRTSGTDYTVSVARAWLAGIADRTTFLNANLRYSRANQYGILGYGGDDQDGALQLELAAALFLNRDWAVGMEYRQKPDNLSVLREQAARDIFLAWFPNKHLSLTAAVLDLGDIAGASDQTGYYLSMQLAF